MILKHTLFLPLGVAGVRWGFAPVSAQEIRRLPRETLRAVEGLLQGGNVAYGVASAADEDAAPSWVKDG